VQRIEGALIQRAGGDPHKPLHNWGLRAIDRSYLQEVESRLQTMLKGIGVAFAALTVTMQGKLCLTADGTSAESMLYKDEVDTLAGLLRDWVCAQARIDRKSMLCRDEARMVHKTLERLEQALGIVGNSD
jgi:hypothetical protein